MFIPVVMVTVVRYSSRGEKIQEFQIFHERPTPELSLEREWLICENMNGNICTVHRYTFTIYSSYTNSVVVYDKSGEVRFRYDGKGRTRRFEFEPHGLATDSVGHILISDNTNNVVHLISQDRDFIAYILTEDDRITCPWGIAVDQSDNLWVVERDNVKVYLSLL